MRFTPTDNWNLIASAAFREVTWKIERKQTTDNSEALSAGTWVDITPVMDEFPGCRQAIEFSVGQFTSDSITLTASKGMFEGGVIQWMKNNVFNASASQYIELKISATMRMGTLSTSDVCYIFSGFVDKAKVQYTESADSCSFTVFTPDDLGNRIASENIATQYINEDVDGGGTDGLVLPKIPNIFVTDANVASYQLKAGYHSITFGYSGGTPQAKLDDGTFVAVNAGGLFTLVNEAGDEKIKIYVVAASIIITTVDIVDYVIVTTPGDTLPQQPYSGVSLSYFLKKIYALVGVTDTTFDTLQFPTEDGNLAFSFYDVPPQDASKTGLQRAAVNKGTDIFIGVGDSVYKRSMASDTYSLVTTKSSYYVARMWYNARNDELWIWYVAATNYIRIYDLTGSSYVDVNLTADTHPYSAELIDYNFSGASYKYGLVFTNNSTGDINLADSTGVNAIFSAISMGVNAMNKFVFATGSGQFVYFYTDGGVTNSLFHQLEIDGGGSWNDNGTLFELDAEYTEMAALHQTESTVYYLIGGTGLYSHTLSNPAITTIETLAATDQIGAMQYLNARVYHTRTTSSNPYYGAVYSLATNTETLVCGTEKGPMQYFFTMCYFDFTLYGVDQLKRLWRMSSTLNMYISDGIFPDMTVRDVLIVALQSHNLIGTISSNKKAFIYRRGDASGTIQTSGNTMVVNVTNDSDIVQVVKAFEKIEWVEISNGNTTCSYDGTNFNTKKLSSAKKFTMENILIPDASVRHLSKYIFTFYNADHDIFTLNVDAALLQYEVMDGADVTFSTTKIQKTATGLIVGLFNNPNGSVQPEVLF